MSQRSRQFKIGIFVLTSLALLAAALFAFGLRRELERKEGFETYLPGNAGFAAPPADLLTAAIREYLRNARCVHDVVEPGDELPADVLVEVYASELSGTSGARTTPRACSASSSWCSRRGRRPIRRRSCARSTPAGNASRGGRRAQSSGPGTRSCPR
jgi:hypothetical protein